MIWSLYQQIQAYSSGVWDGSFLLDVLCGVKTRRPLSFIFFVSGIHPIVDFFAFLADGHKLSVTRACADDFGFVFRALYWLKLHASFFCLAKRITGLYLEEVKCVLTVSCFELTPNIKRQVEQWLCSDIPE